MRRAIIIDSDGVFTDSEPVHLAAFRRALGEIGIFLTVSALVNWLWSSP